MAYAVDAARSAETRAAESGHPLVERARRRVGSTLRNKWHLDALLGVGGMAAVYAATHRNGIRAALKVLHPEVSLDTQWRRRFLREGRAANAVGHDGAVKVLDDDANDDGSVFLVMELLEGESLEMRCERVGGRLPEKEVLWIADQLLDILVAAHAKGIVHRDIKPDNLFLTCSGSLKVLDFGIARLREMSTISSATRGGAMGTPAFMAPEQARGLWDEVDGQSDLFSVGATMFTLLSGRCVHEGRTQNEEMLSAMTVRAPPLSSVVPGVAGSVARVIDRALAPDKTDRWPSAQSMQEAVRRAYYDRTGRRISMAPRPMAPDAAANPMLGLSRDRAAPGHTAQAVAKASIGGQRPRTGSIATAFAAAAAVVVAIGFALVRLGPSSPAPSTVVAAQPASAPPQPAPPTRSTVVNEPSSSPAEPLVPSAMGARSASPPVGAPGTAPVPKPAPKENCATPFVVDPVTHIKHWKVDCL
jgi:serine/threonine-protein kinase